MPARILEMLSYGFLLRALVVGALVALCAALLGVPLVLKRYSMIGDGLSHVGFGALAVASALRWAPLPFAMPVVMLAAFALLRLSESGRIKGDAAIGLISTFALSVGVLVTSLTGGNVDVDNYLFGSILAVSEGDVVLSAALSAAVLVLFMLFYHQIFAVTFDESFARATGIRAALYDTLIALLTAVTIVVGMRVVGTLLISSLLIFPALTSMRLFKRFRSVILSSAIVSVVCFLAGLIASYLLSTPAGASVVAVNALCFAVFGAIGLIRERGRAR
ncbi:MAG: metal ABC transporter permease [Eubacteriales bacterium]|nr:metal ABC transporter permease [Christensenellaceae bacterium]MEA5064680.1 metal ABC transporter permease [Eubacteriales bacterium]